MQQMQLSIASVATDDSGGDSIILPRDTERVYVPPIKCQGIKTKLVPFIFSSVRWDGKGRWIAPFLGSGVVFFNLASPHACVADTNVHIIRLYREIIAGTITPANVKHFLEDEGRKLLQYGGDYFYKVRKRFNSALTSLDFLFLNRSCFNGVMRFNRHGKFNVPFGHKPDGFRQAYITKIVNQVTHLRKIAKGRDWVFEVADWRSTMAHAREEGFIYADPPYAGRHTDYFNGWDDAEATELMRGLLTSPAGFALSTWKQNMYRFNPHLNSTPVGTTLRTTNHFYHVDSKESLRNEMEEALVIRNSHVAPIRPDIGWCPTVLYESRGTTTDELTGTE